jgi:hypothetical protein
MVKVDLPRLNSNGVTSSYWLGNPGVHQLGASSVWVAGITKDGAMREGDDKGSGRQKRSEGQARQAAEAGWVAGRRSGLQAGRAAEAKWQEGGVGCRRSGLQAEWVTVGVEGGNGRGR